MQTSEQGSVEVLARDHLVSFDVLGNRLVDDVLRQLVVAIRVDLEPVTDELLVVRRLRLAGLVALERPEAGAVRRQDLIAEDDVAVLIEAELELRVGDDDAARECVRGALLVDGNRVVAQFLCVFHAMAGELLLEDGSALLDRTLPKNSFQVKKWDRKTYGIGAQILAGLNVQKMRVMGKPSSMNGLTGFGLEVTGFETP